MYLLLTMPGAQNKPGALGLPLFEKLHFKCNRQNTVNFNFVNGSIVTYQYLPLL